MLHKNIKRKSIIILKMTGNQDLRRILLPSNNIFFAYYCSKFSSLFYPFDSYPCNLFYYYFLLYGGKNTTYANVLTTALWLLIHSMNPVPKHYLLTQNISLASSLVSFLINCWINFYMLNMRLSKVLQWWDFSSMFSISHKLIKLIMVIPFGNSHVLVKGFSLTRYKPTVNFRFFNCFVVLSRMIYACVIANRKAFRASPIVPQ